jgi:hypothetical protein
LPGSAQISPTFLAANQVNFRRQIQAQIAQILYYSKIDDDRATVGFKFVKSGRGDESVAILDLKLGRNGNGSQSLFPGSIYNNTGERIDWSSDKGPAWVDGPELLRAVKRVAIGSVLLRRYKSHGDRHTGMFLVLGGVLARADLDRDEAAEFAENIAKVVGDDETANRAKAVRDAWQAHQMAKKATLFLNSSNPLVMDSIVTSATRVADFCNTIGTMRTSGYVTGAAGLRGDPTNTRSEPFCR